MTPQGSNVPSEVRLALHEQRIVDLEGEQKRTRERLHTIEQDRIALKLMAQQVENLAETGKLTTGTLNRLDEKVNTLLLAQAREEGEDSTRRDWLSSRRFVTRALIAGAGLIVALGTALLTVLLHA
jgi:hypothetical protein